MWVVVYQVKTYAQKTKILLCPDQGRSINVVVTDTCPGCGANGIDLSPGAFQALGASLDTGRIPVSWNFV